MSLDELRRALDALGVPPDAYVLDGAAGDECYVLQDQGAEWVTFYSERGLRTGERRFASQDAAAADLLMRIRRDFGIAEPGTR